MTGVQTCALPISKTLEDATAIIIEALIKRISGIMALPIEEIDPGKPIHFYGVDSLVAVEFRNWLAKNLEATIEVLDIMGNDSIGVLSEKIAKASKMLKFGDETAEGKTEGKEDGVPEGTVEGAGEEGTAKESIEDSVATE